MASIVPITDWHGSSSTQSAGLPETTPDMKQMGAIAQRQIDKRYNEWKQQQVSAARAHNADMASVGYDKDKYAALIASGAGLSQMSDHEREYITSHYQATNPFSHKEYTDSVVDQYLASVGMPSSKELNNYRKAYYDYASAGGVKENFSELYNDTDAVAWMRDKWASETKTGANGQRVDSKGKDVTYADTLVDEELRKNDLMPSDQVESYYQRYKEYRATQSKIDQFYTEVYNSSAEMRERATGSKGSKSTQQIFYETLAKPEYQDLAQYIPTETALPDRNANKYAIKDDLGLNVIGFDEDAYNADYMKAVTSRAKSNKTYDWDISYSGYEQYASDRTVYELEQKQARENAALAESAQKWFSSPALSEKEKEQRRTDVEKYLRIFGNGEYDITEFDSYFQMLDIGVPQDVLVQGYTAVAKWNESENISNPSKYADVKLRMEGYSTDDGDYETNKKIVEQTKRVSQNQDYGLFTEYDSALYNQQVKIGVVNYGNGSLVSPEGAIYAAVNGERYTSIDPKADDKNGATSLLLSLSRERNGKSVMSYMTDEEKGVFNFLFRHNVGESIEYLDGLYDMLEDRQNVDANGSFTQRLAMPGVEVTEKEISDYVYDQSAHLYEEQIETVNEGGNSARKRDAWQTYRGYSDEELQKLYDFYWNRYQTTPIRDGVDGVDVELEAQMNHDKEIAEDVKGVLDKRADLRAEADVYASLYEYTDADGEAATAENDHASDIGHTTTGQYHPGMTNGEAVGVLLRGGWSDLTEQTIAAQMTEAQRNRYNWLYENKGREAAAAYYNLLRDHLDEQAADTIEAAYKAEASENKVGFSLLSIPGTFISGIMAFTGTMLNLLTGTELTQSQAAAWDVSNTWREGVSEEMSPFWSFVYGTGMSMADSGVAALFAAAGSGDVGTIGLAASAYASTLHAALDRGLDSKAATQTAIVAGVAEYITEKIGLETLMNAIESIGKGAAGSIGKEFLVNVGKQMLFEGSEEVSADLINLAADALINADMSELHHNIDALIDAGYTKDEATRLAWGDQIKNTTLSFVGGAISGGLMTAGGGAGKLAVGSLYDYAFGSVRTNESASAQPTTEAPTGSVETAGSPIVQNAQTAASESAQENTGAISSTMNALDKTSYLYGYTHDTDGNVIVTDDEQQAIASAIAALAPNSSAETVDAAFVKIMASQQSQEQRAANTNTAAIKTAQEVRNITEQIAKTRDSITTVRTDYQNRLSAAQAELDAANQKVQSIAKKITAVTEINKKTALQEGLKAAQDERDHVSARLNKIQTVEAREAQTRITAAKEEIARQQTLLDKHFASLADFISTYAPAAFDNGTTAQANVNARAAEIGAKIDALISSDMLDSDSQAEALGILREQYTAARGDSVRLSARIANADPNALRNVMNAAKSGNVQQFIREQASNEQNASDGSQTSKPSNETEKAENSASGGVKQDAVKRKKEYAISKTRQQNFSRIARKFGCEIVWGDADTKIGKTGKTLGNRNGAYNKNEPNKIYLNTKMQAGAELSTDMVVAREFFTHEIVHYVANTKSYQTLKVRALAYYTEKYGKEKVNAILNGIVSDERKRGNKVGANYASEELTALFAQEVLFSGQSGNRNALTWLTRTDRSRVGNLLNLVEYLIKRGNARRSKDGSAVKTLLLDSEFALCQALRERQYLDAAGRSSAFGNESQTQEESETMSDTREIVNGDSVRNSRGMTVEDYAELDFTKNRILQEDGTPYDRLYSGTSAAGHTVLNQLYADDGLLNFSTDSRKIAESYSELGEQTPEFDPRTANRDRDQTGTQRDDTGYLRVKHRYGIADNLQLFTMLTNQTGLNKNIMTILQNASDSIDIVEEDEDYYPRYDDPFMSDFGFVDEEDYDDSGDYEWTKDEQWLIKAGVTDADKLIRLASTLASKHSEKVRSEISELYESLSNKLDILMPTAEQAAFAERIGIDEYYTTTIEDSFIPELDAVAGLKDVQLFVKEAILESGIIDRLQEADAGNGKTYIGFDNRYKGSAIAMNEEERKADLPTYKSSPGVYELNVYGENPLDLATHDMSWNFIDLQLLPRPVQERIADLYGWRLGYTTRQVGRAAYETGYDAVIFRGMNDIGPYSNSLINPADIIATYKPYQSKSVYNEHPTTNPDIMYSSGMTIDDYANLYGRKEQNTFGEASNIVTPENVDNDDGRVFRVSDTVQTLKEVPHIQQSVRDLIDNGVIGQADGVLERHGLVYEPITLDRMREVGTRYVAEHGGLSQAMRDLTRDMPRAASRDLVEYMSAANQVFTEIGAEGTFDPNEYYEFVASYIEMRSTWGRVGRAMQLVNDSPLGRVTYWQRVVQRINEKNREAISKGMNPLFYRNGYTDIDVPQALYQELAQAQTQTEIDAAEYAITQYIGQNSPLTVSDALRNWRYFSMLANPVTHARNMLGNMTMLGGRVMKDTIAAGMENAAVRMGLMNESDRTHAVVLTQDADTRAYVEQLWADNGDSVQSGGRDGFKEQLSEAVRKSPSRVVDAAMRFNGGALELEDRLFMYSTFTAAASQYIAAQNLDVHNISRQQQGEIIRYATQQAQEATYRDASKLADALNQFARSGWVQQLLVDAVIPFKKTPFNIAKRGIEYSPAGLAKGLIDIARNAASVSRGGDLRVSASAVVDELAKGLTGTMLAAIGFFLAKCGILKISAGDDDRDSAFERDIGRQDYSLEIGDLSIKIESLAPLTFPLFMGASLQRLTSEEHDGLSVSDFTDAAMTLADPLMDMSFMSSLNDVLSTYNENKLSGVAANAAQAYLGQYLPTIGSRLNQTVNATRRTSKASQASPLGTSWDYWLRSMASKLPGVNQAVLEPYVKTTGEYDTKDSFGDYLLAFSNNFLSPVNVQVIDPSPVNAEVARLVELTGQSDFVPQNPKKYLTIGGERYNMTAKEYTQYSKEHNETVYALLAAVIQSEAYARATEDQRVQMLEKAYDKAHTAVMDKYKIVFGQ